MRYSANLGRAVLSMAIVLLTIAGIACKSGNSTSSSSSASVIDETRAKLHPFRFALATDPAPPRANQQAALKVHVIDAAGQPADGLDVQADLSMPEMSGPHVALAGRGNGNYEGEFTPDMGGGWDVDLTASKDGKTGKQKIGLDVAE